VPGWDRGAAIQKVVKLALAKTPKSGRIIKSGTGLGGMSMKGRGKGQKRGE